MSSYGKYEDRRSNSRRERSPRRDSRRSSPSRSRSPEPRDERELPQQFGRGAEDRQDDDFTVLQRMKKSYTGSPLGCIYKCIDGSRKLKVWTRNFKEVRGICTGYVIAFDKHWNLVMADVDEVFLKPRKAKTPFLSDKHVGNSLPELLPKTPKKKKNPEEGDKSIEEEPKQTEVEPKAGEPEGQQPEKKKKRRKKKKGPTTEKRHVKQLFVRGDNIVMVAILDEEIDAQEGADP